MSGSNLKLLRLQNLYVLIVIALTYTAAQFWPVFSISGLFILMGFILPFVLSPSYFASKLFSPLLFYLIIVAANIFWGDAFFDSSMKLVYEAECLFIPSSMFYYTIEKSDSDTGHNVVTVFIIILILTTIATIVMSTIYPSIIRNSFDYQAQNGEDFNITIYKWGCMNYTFAHAVPCLCPIFICLIRYTQEKIMRVCYIICVISCLIIAYLSGSFACLTMSIISSICSLFVQRSSELKANVKLLSFFTIAAIIALNDNVLLYLLNFLDGLLGSSSDFHEKFIDLQEGVQTGSNQGDFAVRNDYYGQSIRAFVSNILIGTQSEDIGGHSAFLDRLGTLGLIGFIPLIVFLYRSFKYAIHSINGDRKNYYLIGILTSIILLSTKALAGWSVWLVIIMVMPSLLHMGITKEIKGDDS